MSNPIVIEPETSPEQPGAPKEPALPADTQSALPLEAFNEDQQQYLQGFVAGMNAGLLMLGKKPIMNHPEEEKPK